MDTFRNLTNKGEIFETEKETEKENPALHIGLQHMGCFSTLCFFIAWSLIGPKPLMVH